MSNHVFCCNFSINFQKYRRIIIKLCWLLKETKSNSDDAVFVVDQTMLTCQMQRSKQAQLIFLIFDRQKSKVQILLLLTLGSLASSDPQTSTTRISRPLQSNRFLTKKPPTFPGSPNSNSQFSQIHNLHSYLSSFVFPLISSSGFCLFLCFDPSISEKK